MIQMSFEGFLKALTYTLWKWQNGRQIVLGITEPSHKRVNLSGVFGFMSVLS